MGGTDTACRATTDVDNEKGRLSQYVAATKVPDLKMCKALCDTVVPCYGIEFQHDHKQTTGNCEVWIVPIVKFKTGTTAFECFERKGAQPTGTQGFVVRAGFTIKTTAQNFSGYGNATHLANLKTKIKDIFQTALQKADEENQVAKTDTAKAAYKKITVEDVVTVVQGSQLHVKVGLNSTDHHMVNLHNRIRAFELNKKFQVMNMELEDSTHLKTKPIKSDIATQLSTIYGIDASRWSVTWDPIDLIKLSDMNKIAGGVKSSTGPKKGNSGTKASGTTGSPTTHKASIKAAMPCTDADQVIKNTSGVEAFKTAFTKQNVGSLKKNPTLTKYGCRRLKDGARRMSTTGIQADFEYTSTSTQPKQLDANAFKAAVNTALQEVGLPQTTGVTDITPSSTTKMASSAMKMQVVSISLTSLLIAMAWC